MLLHESDPLHFELEDLLEHEERMESENINESPQHEDSNQKDMAKDPEGTDTVAAAIDNAGDSARGPAPTASMVDKLLESTFEEAKNDTEVGTEKSPAGSTENSIELDPRSSASPFGSPAEEPSPFKKSKTNKKPGKAFKKKPQTYKSTQKKAQSRQPAERLSTTRNQVKVFFASSTTIGSVRESEQKLRKLGVAKTHEVPQCDIFCTARPLVRSANLLHALALGRPIVADDWLRDSLAVSMLKDYASYLARDVPRERQWGCKIRETSEKYRKGGCRPFEGKTVVVTPALKSQLGPDSFEGIKTVAKAAGAVDVSSRTPRRAEDVEGTIWLAKHGDPLLEQLEGQRVFGKDLVSMSVLRGGLDLEADEFRLDTSGGGAKEPPRKKRKRA